MDDRFGHSGQQEPVDRRLARWAATRHGIFSRADAVRLGATQRIIRRRLATERWEVLHPGVYRLAGTPSSWRQALLAGCLTFGEEAVASHRAAACLWRLAGVEPGTVEIIVPRGGSRRRRAIIFHEVALPAVDVTSVDAIPVTTPARTLIDLAAVVSKEVVEEALDDALRRGLTSISRLRWRVTEAGRRPGVVVIRALIDARMDASETPQSVLETRLMRLIKRARLPAPTCQHEVRERGRLLAVVDFAYPQCRVAIEADGYRWHSGRARWERDLARRNRLTSQGWRVIHVTPNDLEHHPQEITRTITEAFIAH
jgi:very-short-patch-repair endonuclease/predicted transcriptional regulator of viral defense system